MSNGFPAKRIMKIVCYHFVTVLSFFCEFSEYKSNGEWVAYRRIFFLSRQGDVKMDKG